MLSRRLLLQGGFGAILSGRPASAALKSHGKSPARLAVPDLNTVVAYGEVLVEGRPLTPDERRLLAQHIVDSGAASAEMLDLYRTTSRVLDRLAGGRFSGLALERRRALVTRHRLSNPAVPADETPAPPATMVAVRTRVIPDLIEGYWSSPAGWAAIGYTTFPGRCGDLTRYTRPET